MYEINKASVQMLRCSNILSSSCFILKKSRKYRHPDCYCSSALTSLRLLEQPQIREITITLCLLRLIFYRGHLELKEISVDVYSMDYLLEKETQIVSTTVDTIVLFCLINLM